MRFESPSRHKHKRWLQWLLTEDHKQHLTMRDKSRIPKLLTLLNEVWTENPDLRLGQLIVNAVRPSAPAPQIFSLEDDKMEDKLKELLQLIRTTGNQTETSGQ
jgi:hypothetical protein